MNEEEIQSNLSSQMAQKPISEPIKTQPQPSPHWDPVTGVLESDELFEISDEDSKLQEKFTKLKQNPKTIRNNIFLLSLFVVAGAIISGVLVYFSINNVHIDGRIILMPLAIGSIPLSIYLYSIKEVQKDLINLAIAEKFGWMYNPAKDAKKWNVLRDSYPEIFQLGNENQYFDNEFWGNYENGNRSFWAGRFNYTVRQDKSSTTYHNAIIAFALKKPSGVDFCLKPQNFFTKLETKLSSKVITTESNDFNKDFHINYKGDRGVVGADIFQVLSPELQEKLTQHKDSYKNFSIVIRNNAIYFSYSGEIEQKYTNFKREVVLDDRDAQTIINWIGASINIGDEIVTCLDRM